MSGGGEKRTAVDRIARSIYAVGPSGSAPIAPGTVGSAVAAAALLAVHFFVVPMPWLSPAWLGAILVVLFVGVWATRYAEAVHGKDPGVVVIDEVLGMFVALWLVPGGIGSVIAAFFLFRFFDIVKPYPARRVEREAPGAWGVMLDDLVAGVYANIVLRIALLVLEIVR